MIRTRMLGLIFAGLSSFAGAQTVYKCRDAAGAAVYQSHRCSGTVEQQWASDPGGGAALSSASAAAERSIDRDRQHLKASKQALTRRGGKRGSRVRASAPSPCERERKARAAAHARRGLHWSFDDASYWDGRVFKVCR